MAKLVSQDMKLLEVYKNRYMSYGLREGQSYINSLYDISPSLYEEVSGTDADCFYVDDLIPNFLKFLNDEEQTV